MYTYIYIPPASYAFLRQLEQRPARRPAVSAVVFAPTTHIFCRLCQPHVTPKKGYHPAIFPIAE